MSHSLAVLGVWKISYHLAKISDNRRTIDSLLPGSEERLPPKIKLTGWSNSFYADEHHGEPLPAGLHDHMLHNEYLLVEL